MESQAYPFDFQLKTFCVAGLAWLSNPLAGTDFKDGVFGKSSFGRKSKNTCFRKIGIIDGYQHQTKRIIENNDGISTNRQ